MSTVTSVKNSASRQYLLLGLGGLVILCLGAAGMYFLGPLLGVSSTTTAAAEQEDHDEDGHPGEEGRAEGETADRVVFPKVQWKTADLKIADVEKTDLPTFKWVTGKLTVNRDQAAEIYPLVEGRVHQVQVRFGETVETGHDVLGSVGRGFGRELGCRCRQAGGAACSTRTHHIAGDELESHVDTVRDPVFLRDEPHQVACHRAWP